MKGTYCLVIFLEEPATIQVGRLGLMEFRPGHYVYVGSALSGLEGRIRRHLSTGNASKKRFWHIDYLLEHGAITGIRKIISPERLECSIARKVGALSEAPVKGFGCSDCSCETHLFSFPNNPLSKPEFEDIWAAERLRN